MINLHSKKVGFKGFCLVMVLLLHNLDSCTGIGPYYDKEIEQGHQQQTPPSLSSQELTAEHTSAQKTKEESNSSSSDVADSIPSSSNNKSATLPPKLFPTNSPNSSLLVPILTIDDCANVTRFLSHSTSASDNSSSAPVYLPTPPTSAAAAPDSEADDMVHGNKYGGQYDVDQVKGGTKKFDNTKSKNVTKPTSVIDSKKDAKVDFNKNGTKSSTPDINNNNKTATAATVEDASRTEAKSLPENKTTLAVEKAEEERKVEVETVVTVPPQIEVLPPQKSGSTLREVGKTLAAILVTIVGTATMLFVGFVMWRRISRRYYGHREMLINEDDFEEVSDLHHFEGATDTPPSHTIISQR